MKLLVMQFSPVFFNPSLFCPNILLNTMFSNTLSLCSSLTFRDHVSHPYSNRGNIIVLYILTFTFFDSRREDLPLQNDVKYERTIFIAVLNIIHETNKKLRGL
jgi:hypothetical protein